MKRIISTFAVFAAAITLMAQSNFTINGKLEGYKPTDTLTVYVPGQERAESVDVASNGTFTVKSTIKQMSEVMLFLNGRGGQGRDHSVVVLVEPGDEVSVNIKESKKDANGKFTLVPTFKSNDVAKQIYASDYYNNITRVNRLDGKELAKTGSFSACSKRIDEVINPITANIKKMKDTEFQKTAYRVMESLKNEAFFNYAIANEEAGVKMENDAEFMAFVNAINPNDTLQTSLISNYLIWYNAAHPDEFAPLKDDAAILKHLDSYTSNQKIKNKIANSKIKSIEFYEMYGVITADPQFKDLYDQYMAICTDTTYHAFVKRQLDKMEKVAPGKPALNFALKDVDDKDYEFKDMVGNGVVTYVDFWATWCGPCKREIPYLAKLVEALKGKKVRIISISIDQDHDAWKKMVKEDKPEWEQYLIPDIANSEAITGYDIMTIPRFMLFDADGNVYKSQASRPSEAQTKEIIESLIK